MQTTDYMCKFNSLWHSAGPLAFGLQAPKQGLFKAGCDDDAMMRMMLMMKLVTMRRRRMMMTMATETRMM
jgi:hypothetical protein